MNEPAKIRTTEPIKPADSIFCVKCGGTPERKKRVRVTIGSIQMLGPCNDKIHRKQRGS